MTEEEKLRLEALEGMAMAHAALFAGVIGVLKARQVITRDEVMEIFEIALTGLENSQDLDDVSRGARLYLNVLVEAQSRA